MTGLFVKNLIFATFALRFGPVAQLDRAAAF